MPTSAGSCRNGAVATLLWAHIARVPVAAYEFSWDYATIQK